MPSRRNVIKKRFRGPEIKFQQTKIIGAAVTPSRRRAALCSATRHLQEITKEGIKAPAAFLPRTIW